MLLSFVVLYLSKQSKIDQRNMTTEIKTQEQEADYNVRFVGPRFIRKALKAEQYRIYQETNETIPVMEIAARWMIEKSNQVLKTDSTQE